MHITHEPAILHNRHLELLSGYQCYQEPNGRLIVGPLSPARAAWSKLWVSLFWKRKVEAKMDALSTVAPGMLGRSWTVRSPGQVRFAWKIRRQPGNLFCVQLRTTKCPAEEIFQHHGLDQKCLKFTKWVLFENWWVLARCGSHNGCVAPTTLDR